MRTEEELLKRIILNPKVMAGKPVVKGTRIPVEQILSLLAQGTTIEQVLEDYPHLERDDIMAALLYAAKLTSKEEVYPVISE